MDKKTLKQYRPLKREQEMIEKKLDKLEERKETVPAVYGKVKGSAPEFPYIETHMTVAMWEPKRMDSIDRQRIINEKRKDQVNALLIEIEEFIADIPDSTHRQIFEMVFLDGKTQQEVGESVGYSKGRVSQIISQYVKD
ncbi:MAG TPA: sigma-70 family RNA polymerase sigma factor [Candidatus Anaerostipes avistercoris]|uniref:Sigma-70 family RNA polymerase sigma factor n=1 Tax=Candidatus Anaerostipes avistercoris TaxID=2838462 RepID=A0A9D2PGL1_9FIRM|nr:sigma-70 family RNA polymerase sigma factor [Candidatus Anaerostipes avistercoris]